MTILCCSYNKDERTLEEPKPCDGTRLTFFLSATCRNLLFPLFPLFLHLIPLPIGSLGQEEAKVSLSLSEGSPLNARKESVQVSY